MAKTCRPSQRSRILFSRQRILYQLTKVALVLWVFCLLLRTGSSSDSHNGDDDNKMNLSKETNDTTTTKSATSNTPRKMLTLAESLDMARKSVEADDARRREYWKRTFEEIRNLSSMNTAATAAGSNGKSASFFSQWKLLLDAVSNDVDDTVGENNVTNVADTAGVAASAIAEDESKITSSDIPDADVTAQKSPLRRPWQKRRKQQPRFEGFPSWERMLQEWSEEVSEYLEKAGIETNKDGGEYSFSNFGRPPSTTPSTTAKDVDVDTRSSSTSTSSKGDDVAESIISTTTTIPVNGGEPRAAVNVEKQQDTTTTKNKGKVCMPVPRAAKEGEAVLPHTDLSDLSKRIEIVTTAALPWMTGTAVNPLLRAAYLVKGRAAAGGSVTLMLPWLERAGDRERVYGKERAATLLTPQNQEDYIRNWLLKSAKMPESIVQELRIRWYTAWQNPVENSIYSMGDITALIPDEEVDICILEEPEHLNWYRAPGENWTKKFKHVVGILHTNYFQYALDQPAALIRAPAMQLLVAWMCRAHCHRVIKLSGTLGQVAPEKELTENVHGVRGTFVDVGKEVRSRLQSTVVAKSDPVFAPDAKPTLYFIGKMLWSKGLGSLMELLKYVEESADLSVKMDMYGGGPDMEEAQAKAKTLGLDFEFHGPLDHSEIAYTHKVFINPSTSEVLCTTSAEALAMGKFVILPSHPSNDFFAQFPNCLTYSTKDEFVGNLFYAMTHSPEPLSEAYAHALSWEAATERLVAASAIPVAEAELMQQALSSKEAGIEISLPPLVESEEGRKLISQTFRQTRERYRTFRSRLSAEVLQNRVLPASLKERLLNELDKRLDIDIDEILEKPKLRLQLSPAELDKTLLELYDNVGAGATGDALRVIGGGGQVAFQTMYMYMRKQATKQQQRAGTMPDLIPFYLDEVVDDDDTEGPGVQTIAQRVRSTLRKNLPRSPPRPAPTKQQEEKTPMHAATTVPFVTSSISNDSAATSNSGSGTTGTSSSSSSTREVPRMSVTCYSRAATAARVNRPEIWAGLASPSSLARLSATSSSLRLSRSVSMLI